MKTRYFIHPKAGGRFWCVEITDATVTVQHGKVGGKLTTAAETFTGKNAGKANEVTPEQDAINRTAVTIEKKVREGYVEYARRRGDPHMGDYGIPGLHPDYPGDQKSSGCFYRIGEEIKAEIDFDNLPEKLCFYKPDNTVSNAGLTKKLTEGKCWYTRKRNGLAYVIAKGPTGKVQMYSRTMRKQHDKELDTDKTWNDRFPHIVAAAAEMMALNSIIVGELIVNRDGTDDFKYCQRLAKSTTHDAIQLQIGLGPECKQASFYVWDMPFWSGENLLKHKTAIRFERIKQELTCASTHKGVAFDRYGPLIPIQVFTNTTFTTPEAAIKRAKELGWEGFVVVDPDGIYGDKGFNFKGKPDRPRAYCAKLKPRYEDDFVVDFDPDNGVGKWSTKEKYATGEARGIHNVVMFQYDSNGKKHEISELGVGLSAEMKTNLADPKLFPQVWEVSYADRRYIAQGDDSNALDFSSFEEVRWKPAYGKGKCAEIVGEGDKLPEECINPLLDEEG